MDKLRIGVIGCGYWGPNLIRNLGACPQTEVAAVFDADASRREAAVRIAPAAKPVASLEQLLEQKLDGVAIATPVSTHYALARQCLEAGLHVLVEKPLCSTVADAQALVECAQRQRRVLMVDHTYLFSGAVRLMRKLLSEGELGDLYYVDSVRINLGLFQRDINVVWDLAPHDLSIVDYLLGLEARSISAWGCAHARESIEDLAYVNVDYGERLMANFHLSWLSPMKVRQMIFAGSRKSLIFNELNVAEPVKVYDRGIEMGQGAQEQQRLQINYRMGDIWSPNVEPGEALQGMVRHFAQCIRGETAPLSDGNMGVRVVRLLEAATRSLRAQGGRIVLTNGSMAYANHSNTSDPRGELSSDRAGRSSGAEPAAALLR